MAQKRVDTIFLRFVLCCHYSVMSWGPILVTVRVTPCHSARNRRLRNKLESCEACVWNPIIYDVNSFNSFTAWHACYIWLG